MKHKTKLNLATLDEAVLQRYYFEQMAFGSTETRRSLLPPFLKGKAAQFKAIIKEKGTEPPKTKKATKNKNHRPDFLIIFSEGSYNAEIKWKASKFNHPPSWYKKSRGFVVALDDDSKVKPNKHLENISVVEIVRKDFEKWFELNAYLLLKDHLQSNEIAEKSFAHWIVYAGQSVANNIKIGVKTKTWAFKNHANIREIIRIRKGDQIIFVRARNFAAHKLSDDSRVNIKNIKRFDCVEGHYFNTAPDGTCFEPKIQIEKREFIHFIGVKEVEICEGGTPAMNSENWVKDEIDLVTKPSNGITEEIRTALINSQKNLGAPFRVSEDGFKQLVSAARKQIREQNQQKKTSLPKKIK